MKAGADVGAARGGCAEKARERSRFALFFRKDRISAIFPALLGGKCMDVFTQTFA